MMDGNSQSYIFPLVVLALTDDRDDFFSADQLVLVAVEQVYQILQLEIFQPSVTVHTCVQLLSQLFKFVLCKPFPRVGPTIEFNQL